MTNDNDRGSDPSTGSAAGEPPFVSASCPRCGLTFSEPVDSSAFTADEMRAVQCGANALRVAANRVASYDDQRYMELMADHIDAMLSRMG
jgi:hypothetical protein